MRDVPLRRRHRPAADETGSAATEAYLRAIAMGADFEARDRPVPRRARARRWNTCHDYGRKELRHEKRSRQPRHDVGRRGRGRPVRRGARPLRRAPARQAEEAREAEAGREEAERLARWGIAQVRNDNYRTVLELTWLQKLDAETIAARLGISVDNVYQRRRRGLIELEKILRAPRD